MGQIKNIKLHIVTDIKGNQGKIYLELLQEAYPSYSSKMGGEEVLTAEQLARTGFLKHFNSDTNNGRRNFVLLTIAGYAGIFAAYKTVKWLKAKPVEEKS